MTPLAFAKAYGPLANHIGSAVWVDANVILAQWALETGWGASGLCVNWHNLAGIRWYGRAVQYRQIGGTPGRSGTGFAAYRTLDDFAVDYEYVISLPYYNGVRDAVTTYAQIKALGASPWDAGHYRTSRNGIDGGSVLATYNAIIAALNPPPPTPAPAPLPTAQAKYGGTVTTPPAGPTGQPALVTPANGLPGLAQGLANAQALAQYYADAWAYVTAHNGPGIAAVEYNGTNWSTDPGSLANMHATAVAIRDNANKDAAAYGVAGITVTGLE